MKFLILLPACYVFHTLNNQQSFTNLNYSSQNFLLKKNIQIFIYLFLFCTSFPEYVKSLKQKKYIVKAIN